MVCYDTSVEKDIKKGNIPTEIVKLFINAFSALDNTKDLNLFDIKSLKSSDETDYYRLRKGKYRAIFFMKDDNFYVQNIAKREDVYKKWQ